MAHGQALPPGATIGIVGGGQLGRMTALAAARLGYRCHIYCPQPGSPAAQVAAAATVAAYDDGEALESFAAAVDVVTYEFENLPVAAFARMGRRVPVRPHWRCLEATQHRGREKALVNRLGIATAPWRPVARAAELPRALAAVGRRAVLKTARMGYDGKGQATIGPGDDAEAAWAAVSGGGEAVLEGFVDFEREISAIVARGGDGRMASFDAVENLHRRHILAETRAPARIAASLARQAREIAARLAEALDLVGLLAVEMFVTRDGRLLVNELAARPHNSGHWTIDACHCSQFEQLVRAVAGLPLGDPARHSDAVMTNLLGGDAGRWRALAGEAGACLHLYGKERAREGRKMGHVTRLFPKSAA